MHIRLNPTSVKVFYDIEWWKGSNPENIKVPVASSQESAIYIPPKKPQPLPINSQGDNPVLGWPDAQWAPWFGLRPNNAIEWWLKIKSENFMKSWSVKGDAEVSKSSADAIVDATFSERYTQFYLQNIEAFKTAKNSSHETLSSEESVNLSGEFMKVYGYRIQAVFRDPSIQKESRREQIKQWRQEFISEQQIQLWDDTITNESTSTETDHIAKLWDDNALDDAYDLAHSEQIQAQQELDQANREYEREAYIYTDALLKQHTEPNQRDIITWTEGTSDTSHLPEPNPTIHSMWDAMEAISPGNVGSFNIIDESGEVSQFRMVHLPQGDYVLCFPPPENGKYIIDSYGEKRREEVSMIMEVIKTPLLRRLVSMGSQYFEQFQNSIKTKFPGKDISDPRVFEKYAYQALFSFMSKWHVLKDVLLEKIQEPSGLTATITGLQSDATTAEALRREFRMIWIMKQPDGKEFVPEQLLDAINKLTL